MSSSMCCALLAMLLISHPVLMLWHHVLRKHGASRVLKIPGQNMMLLFYEKKNERKESLKMT